MNLPQTGADAKAIREKIKPKIGRGEFGKRLGGLTKSYIQWVEGLDELTRPLKALYFYIQHYGLPEGKK